MGFGDMLKKAASKGMEMAGEALEKGKEMAEAAAAAKLEAERKAQEEKLEAERKAQEEELAAARAFEEERKKAIEEILKPSCEKGDCVWNDHKFYFTCGNTECPRKNLMSKDFGKSVTRPDVWPFMKRYAELEKIAKDATFDAEVKDKIETHFTKDVIQTFFPAVESFNCNLYENIYWKISKYGVSPDSDFFNLLYDIKDFDWSAIENKIAFLYREIFDFSPDFYRNPSLYNREQKDFEYTVRLFDTVTHDYKLSELLYDTSVVDYNQLFDADGNIKPVGIGGAENGFYGFDYLWNITNSWEGENGENEIPH